MRGRRAVVLAAAGMVALLLGCLDFEEQELTIAHDAEQDRLTIVIDYRGFYAETEDPEGTAFYRRDVHQARVQLERAVANRTVALFSNWPIEIDLEQLREDGVPEGWAEPLIRARINDFVKGVDILNAGFYRDTAGRACGMQVVTVENISTGIALANEFLNRQIRSALLRRLRGPGRDDFMARIPGYLMPYVERGHTWIELRDGSVTLNLPFPDTMPDEQRRQVLGGMFLASADELSDVPRQFSDRLGNTVSLRREGDVLKATYAGEGGVLRLRARSTAGGAAAELLRHVEERHGFGLDVALGRFIGEVDRAENADRAVQLVAPLLSPRARLRALLRTADRQQLPAIWEALRAEAAVQAPDAETSEMSREELARLCADLLGGATASE